MRDINFNIFIIYLYIKPNYYYNIYVVYNLYEFEYEVMRYDEYEIQAFINHCTMFICLYHIPIMSDRLCVYADHDRSVTSVYRWWPTDYKLLLFLTARLLFAYRFDRSIRVVCWLWSAKYRLDRPNVSWFPTTPWPTMTGLIPTDTD